MSDRLLTRAEYKALKQKEAEKQKQKAKTEVVPVISVDKSKDKPASVELVKNESRFPKRSEIKGKSRSDSRVDDNVTATTRWVKPKEHASEKNEKVDLPKRVDSRVKLKKRGRKSLIAYWVSLVLCCLAVALFYRYFFIRQYAIPTNSMEPGLTVGSRVFVLSPTFANVLGFLNPAKAAWIIVAVIVLGICIYLLYLAYSRKWLVNVVMVAVFILTGFIAGLVAYPDTGTVASNLKTGDVVVFNDKHGWLTGKDKNSGHLIKRVIGKGGDKVEITPENVIVNGNILNEPYVKVNHPYQRLSVKVPKGKFFVMGDNREHSADSRSHLGDGNRGMVDSDQIVGKPVLSIK